MNLQNLQIKPSVKTCEVANIKCVKTVIIDVVHQTEPQAFSITTFQLQAASQQDTACTLLLKYLILQDTTGRFFL